eukprot:2855982-Rhodomonas_salina.1
MALAGEFEEVDHEMQLTVFLMLPWHDEGVIEVEKCVMRATIAPKMFANGCSHTTVVVGARPQPLMCSALLCSALLCSALCVSSVCCALLCCAAVRSFACSLCVFCASSVRLLCVFCASSACLLCVFCVCVVLTRAAWGQVLAVLLFLALFLAGGLAALFLLFRRKYIETKITRQYEIFQG